MELSSYHFILMTSCLISMIPFTLFWLYIKLKIYQENDQLDIDHLTPSDYTICITGFRFDDDFDENKFIDAIVSSSLYKDCIVRRVFMYDIESFVDYSQQLEELNEQKAYVEKYKKYYSQKLQKEGLVGQNFKVEDIHPPSRNLNIFSCMEEDFNIESINKKLLRLEMGLVNRNLNSRNNLKIPKCFITLRFPKMADELLNQKKTSVEYKQNKEGKIINKHYKIKISKPPEANDIKFENLNSTIFRRIEGKD